MRHGPGFWGFHPAFTYLPPHQAEDDGFWHKPEGEGRQQALAHALAPAGRGAVARRRLQQEYDIPRVQQFEGE